MITVPAVREKCAGIDVGKRAPAVAVATGPADKEAEIRTREFGTTNPALKQLRQWLTDEGCGSVAIESTGSYWIPVKNALEGAVEVLLVCPRKHHPKKGDKTDFRDAVSLAHQHRHGLLTGSFLPETAIVELRDLTRRRKKLLTSLQSEKNRIQKVLETAGVKMGNVISDVFGVSGQEILSALLSGRPIAAAELADFAKRRLRLRIPELTEALEEHYLNDHHRWLIRQSVDHIVLVDRQLEDLEARIQEKLGPYRFHYDLLLTVPGIKEHNAAAILAEIGPDMSQFPTGGNLTSWAGICPGNNRSGGKSRSAHIGKANRFLLVALVEAGWGAARTRGTRFERQFQRWQRNLGRKKALIALCHSLLRTIHAMLRDGRPYRESDTGTDAEERMKRARHHAKHLRRLGLDAETCRKLLEQLEAAHPAAPAPVPPPREPAPPPKRPPIPRRGALGFRARQTRAQQPKRYAVVTEQ